MVNTRDGDAALFGIRETMRLPESGVPGWGGIVEGHTLMSLRYYPAGEFFKQKF